MKIKISLTTLIAIFCLLTLLSDSYLHFQIVKLEIANVELTKRVDNLDAQEDEFWKVLRGHIMAAYRSSHNVKK